jgi:hypothetical protein
MFYLLHQLQKLKIIRKIIAIIQYFFLNFHIAHLVIINKKTLKFFCKDIKTTNININFILLYFNFQEKQSKTILSELLFLLLVIFGLKNLIN